MAEELESSKENPKGPGMENLLTCPNCQFVYDIRYLSESCRFDEEKGYFCRNCGAHL